MRDTIAVCIARMDENFQTDSLKAICKRADEVNLSVQVFNAFEELVKRDLYDKGEESIFENINYDRLCGLILFCEKIKDNDLNLRLIEKSKENGIPVVCIDRYVEECYSITFDYANSFEKIVRHLVEVHHCKTFFVMGGFRNNSFSDERIGVVKNVLAEYGIALSDDDIGYGDFWESPCRNAMKEFMDSGKPIPDAFIAANDTMAITICDVLHNAGYRVPEDTIVTGFDGIEMERYVVPRLTTAQQNIEAGSVTAVDIIAQIKKGNHDVERHTIIPFENRYSQSCGCQPIIYNSVSSQIRNLYNNLTASRTFNKYMYEMIIDMTGQKTMGSMIKYLPKYISYLTGFRHIYVCVEEYLIEGDEELMAAMVERNRKNAAGEKQGMVVLGEYHAATGFVMSLTRFAKEEQLPEYDTVIKNIKHIVLIPLHKQDIVFGYLVLDMNPEANDYYQLSNFATNLSHSIDTVKQHHEMRRINEKLTLANDKLEELYIRDPLTGIYNRRGFYQEIQKKLEQHERGWMMMISLDLDGLKQINDLHGHGEGDFAIKMIGRAIANCSVGNGICARFGGDEFSAALFFDEYEEFAEKNLKDKLENYLAKINERYQKPYRISASCGTQMGEIGPELDLDALLKAADDKMYITKGIHHKTMIRQTNRDHISNS